RPKAKGSIAVALALVVALWASAARAQPLIVGNQTGFGPQLIFTWDFATGDLVASFFPEGALAGLGVAVLGNKIYFTEGDVVDDTAATLAIRIAPFNAGFGGADIGMLPNPRPGSIVPALATSDGVLYALTSAEGPDPLQVFGLDPLTGDVLSGPVN